MKQMNLVSPVFTLYQVLNEPRCEKTGFLHMRKQRRRSASRLHEVQGYTAKLISDFVLATQMVQSIYIVLPKSEISSQALAIFCCCTAWFVTRPGRKPRRPVFSERGSKLGYFCDASIMLRKCIYKVLFNRVFNSVDILAWTKS